MSKKTEKNNKSNRTPALSASNLSLHQKSKNLVANRFCVLCKNY
jgi:hypothetical protein